MLKNLFISNSLSTRLLKLIVATYILFSIIILSSLGYYNYKDVSQKIDNEISSILEALERSFEECMWSDNYKVAKTLSSSLANIKYIDCIEIYNRSKELYISDIKNCTDDDMKSYSKEIFIKLDEAEMYVGELVVYSHKSHIIDEIWNFLVIIMIGFIVKTIFIFSVSYFIFQKYFVAHIKRLSQQVKNINFYDLKDTKIKLEQDDIELSLLANNFNEMIDKLNRSLTQKKEQEMILVQQSKLASMGEMIGNIAHQWRQPLNSLSIKLMNLEQKSKQDEVSKEYLEKFIKNSNIIIQALSSTIDDFLNFFKQNKEKDYFDLVNTIDDVLFILKDTFKQHNIQVYFYRVANIKLFGVKSEFAQVILNILNNSKDCFINKSIQHPKINIKIIDIQDSIAIEITDNGGGISKEILDKVFEPYFTTKHKAQGVGIGLYMSKIIIEKNMNGKIKIENILDGAKTTITLKNIKHL